MLPFSLLERFAVQVPGAAPGRAGRLLDLAYAPDDADHHRVTHCRVRLNGQPPLALPWEAVAALDAPAARLRLAEAPGPNAAEPNGDLIWIGDDVLDALILDLGQTRTVTGFRYVPRQGGGSVGGRIKDYRILIGDGLVQR